MLLIEKYVHMVCQLMDGVCDVDDGDHDDEEDDVTEMTLRMM